jgi:hypothetical protein
MSSGTQQCEWLRERVFRSFRDWPQARKKAVVLLGFRPRTTSMSFARPSFLATTSSEFPRVASEVIASKKVERLAEAMFLHTALEVGRDVFLGSPK